MGVISFFSALTGHESVPLGVGSLFYITGRQFWASQDLSKNGRDFNLAKPRTDQWKNQLHFNEKTKQSLRKESAI